MYRVGTVPGQREILGSDNAEQSWVRINEDAYQWILVLHITGNPKKYGRVCVETHGRGVPYGDPRSTLGDACWPLRREKGAATSELRTGKRKRKCLVGPARFELATSPLSGVRSNQLSYEPDAKAHFTMTPELLTRYNIAQWKKNAIYPSNSH